MALGDKERAKKNFLKRIVHKRSSTQKRILDKSILSQTRRMGNLCHLLEVPNYVPLEIEKLDIEVDELVSNRKDLPDVVLRSLYESQSLELT